MSKSFNSLKTSIDKIRKDSLDVVGQANKIVSQGVHRLAEHELKALNDTYKNVLSSLKSSKSGESVKDLAAKQLDLMQDTVTRLIASAKDSLNIVAETRHELTGLVQKGLKSGAVAETELNKITAKAKKAVADVKTAAADAQKSAAQITSQVTAQAKSSADKMAAAVKTDAKKVAATVKSDVKIVKHKLGSVLDIKPKAVPVKKPVVAAKPSANSRAAAASSKAKQAAAKVTSTVKKMG
ncbi:MAG: phasin family protein [Pseudomonadota bacterium]